ncbi:MAG TPA: pilus assembly protein PilP [Thermoanaerobaculia bacterium]|jgi:Tfp pilus assembly protein PilP
MSARNATLRLLAVTAALAALAASPAAAQAPAAPPPPPAETPKITDQDFTPSVYTYEVGGRRDPFRSLLVRNPSEKERVRPPGLAGVMVDELELQGTIKVKQGWVAMMRGPDNKSHLIRKGTTLFDGEVTDVSATEVTFRQNVNDPTNPKPFREVVKALALQKKQ